MWQPPLSPAPLLLLLLLQLPPPLLTFRFESRRCCRRCRAAISNPTAPADDEAEGLLPPHLPWCDLCARVPLRCQHTSLNMPHTNQVTESDPRVLRCAQSAYLSEGKVSTGILWLQCQNPIQYMRCAASLPRRHHLCCLKRTLVKNEPDRLYEMIQSSSRP